MKYLLQSWKAQQRCSITTTRTYILLLHMLEVRYFSVEGGGANGLGRKCRFQRVGGTDSRLPHRSKTMFGLRTAGFVLALRSGPAVFALGVTYPHDIPQSNEKLASFYGCCPISTLESTHHNENQRE